MNKSTIWQVCVVIVVGMEDEGVTLVYKTLVGGGHAVGVAATSDNEWISTQTEGKVFPDEVTCPKQNAFVFSIWYDWSRIEDFISNTFLNKNLEF